MAKDNRIYPAVFHKEGNRYWVEFPDVEGCFTEGDSLEQAFIKAKEALALGLDGKIKRIPSKIESIKANNNDTVMLVEADSLDNIEYIAKTKVAKAIENGLVNKGYTKYQMAFILGVDRGYITHLIKGERTPSVEMAKRIAVLLDFDWKLFYEGISVEQ